MQRWGLDEDDQLTPELDGQESSDRRWTVLAAFIWLSVPVVLVVFVWSLVV